MTFQERGLLALHVPGHPGRPSVSPMRRRSTNDSALVAATVESVFVGCYRSRRRSCCRLVGRARTESARCVAVESNDFVSKNHGASSAGHRGWLLNEADEASGRVIFNQRPGQKRDHLLAVLVVVASGPSGRSSDGDDSPCHGPSELIAERSSRLCRFGSLAPARCRPVRGRRTRVATAELSRGSSRRTGRRWWGY